MIFDIEKMTTLKGDFAQEQRKQNKYIKLCIDCGMRSLSRIYL